MADADVIRFPVERTKAAQIELEIQGQLAAERSSSIMNPGARCGLCLHGGTSNDGVTFCSVFTEEIMFDDVAENCGEWSPS